MKNVEGWMKNDEGWMKNDEGWMMKVEWWRIMISSCWGVLVYDRQMDGRTDICECRVAFSTENVMPKTSISKRNNPIKF